MRLAKIFYIVSKLQSVFRRYLTIRRVHELREFRSMCASENIRKIENGACIAVQKCWRHVLLQRKLAEDERIRKIMLLENEAATAIVSGTYLV